MPYKIIERLVEDLSLEFVLLDSSESESLSVLLPIIENIQGASQVISNDTFTHDVSRIESIIKDTIESKKNAAESEFEMLGQIISEMKSFLHNLKNSEEDDLVDSNGVLNTNYESIEKSIEKFSKLISGFCPEEIPDLGSMITILDELITQTDAFEATILSTVADACKNYVENMTLENINNTKPIEEGVVLLKSILSHLKQGKIFAFDYSDVLDLLQVKFREEQRRSPPTRKPWNLSPQNYRRKGWQHRRSHQKKYQMTIWRSSLILCQRQKKILIP